MSACAALVAANAQWASLPAVVPDFAERVRFARPTAELIRKLRFVNLNGLRVVICPRRRGYFIAKSAVCRHRHGIVLRSLTFDEENLLD